MSEVDCVSCSDCEQHVNFGRVSELWRGVSADRLSLPHLGRVSLHGIVADPTEMCIHADTNSCGIISICDVKSTIVCSCSCIGLVLTTMTKQTLLSSFHITSSGSKLHYLQTGCSSGPLLLCLHGLGGSTETFIPLLPYLPSCYSIVLLDFPGFGESPFIPKSTTATVSGYVADLGEFIAALQGFARPLQARDVVIIGHSLGAIIALQYAAQYPETIGGLALLGSGRAAGQIPAARQRMCDLAAAVRTKGLDFAANIATESNFYEAT
jgi:hypothetical protein